MRQMFACAAVAAFLFFTWSAESATAAHKAPARKTSSAKKTSSGRKSTSAKSTARKSTRKTPAKPVAAWRTRQSAPTPARYRQIQEALAAKGYLSQDDVTGAWNQNSVEALRRFQAEQNIESTGKINSLSLIALGLGPKHDSAATKPAPAAQPPVPEATSSRM